MKRVYKPNLVPAETGGDHSSRLFVTKQLERPTRKRCRISSTLNGPFIAFSYLALHHEEFTWPRLLPATPVSSYLTLSPLPSAFAGGGLLSVALVVVRLHVLPDVIRLAALGCSDFPLPFTEAITRRASFTRPLQYNKKC